MPSPRQAFTDSNGKPLANGMVFTYAAGTSTPLAAYQDAAGLIAHENPIRLDARGEATVYFIGNYKIDAKTSAGRQLTGYPVDNFSVPDLSAAATALGDSLLTGTGADQIGFLQDGSGAQARGTGAKARDQISILDFIPKVQHAAILNGTSTFDATTYVQRAIDQAGSLRRLVWLGTVCTRLISSGASVDWLFDSGAKIKQVPAVYIAGSAHVSLTGPRVRLEGYTGDGNQAGMASGQGSNGLLVSGVSPTLINVISNNYNGRGYDFNSVSTGARRALHIDCSFDDNAGLGMQTSQAAFADFMGCTFDRNGYGFQKTRANYADISHGFVAFGTALRYRSHHINFNTCWARDNGRDGFNVNQGSYAISFNQCVAHGNDDGGFTIASDATSSGLPGESEACYDISYIGCEAYNNYSSGLAAYQATHNLKVIGGRYYNNHRLAGNQAAASSYYNGIYIANGSTGHSIDAACYDDRQYRAVTAVSGGVVTATGWVPGAMNSYPKVGVYRGTDGVFKGYGKITAESAGSVTITPTTVDGVVVANIVSGDYITQAVQHNGIFCDNNTQGAIACDGAGHRPGAQGTTGFNVYSGGFTFGQNVVLPKERTSNTELMTNPGFETDTTGWTYSLPGGGTQTYHTGVYRRSAGSLQLTAGTGQADADCSVISGALQAMFGQFVDVGMWVYATGRGDAECTLYWLAGGPSLTTKVIHPGGGWRYLRISAQIPGNSTSVFLRLSVPAGKTAWFDSGRFRTVDVAMDPRDYTFPTRALPL